MFYYLYFWCITYIICSFNFKNIKNIKIPYNPGKSFTKIIKYFNYNKKFSSQIIFTVLNYIKCPIFILISFFIFKNKYMIDITAIIAYFANYFPIWNFFKNNSKNFISIIFSSVILDPITGLSMIFTFLLSLKCFGYLSLATASAMTIGIIKTFIHMIFFSNKDYISSLFFIIFGVLAICRNIKIIRYICEKSVKKDIILTRNKKNTPFSTGKITINQTTKIIKTINKYSKKISKSKLYKNYKKFYTNNKKFEEQDKKYEK